jgi:DNA (cytosine-5)-methyltransferase 1
MPTIPTGQGGGVMTKIAIPVLTPNRVEKRQNGRRFKEAGDPSFTLTGQDIHGVAINTRIRRLTPKECERLQGFPDDWTKYGIGDEPISDTQRYKMCGNAVTTNVITAVMEKLL